MAVVRVRLVTFKVACGGSEARLCAPVSASSSPLSLSVTRSDCTQCDAA